MKSRLSLEGKVVLLTGGAGIYGRGLAADLAGAGSTVVLAARNLAACKEVAGSLSREGLRAHALCYDQSDTSSIPRRADSVEKSGQFDGLVNSAVSRPMTGPQGTIGEWEESMKVNAIGVFAMHKIFGKMMAARKEAA